VTCPLHGQWLFVPGSMRAHIFASDHSRCQPPARPPIIPPRAAHHPDPAAEEVPAVRPVSMLDDVQFWAQVVGDSRRTVYCHAIDEHRIRAALDQTPFAGLIEVHVSPVTDRLSCSWSTRARSKRRSRKRCSAA
jgi:hypothetical protein